MGRYDSPILNITLPPAITIPTIPLTLLYGGLLTLDYFLLRYDSKLPINPTHLRIIIGLYHFIIPFCIDSPYAVGNISFMLQPWASTAQIVYLSQTKTSLTEWIPKMIKIATFQDTQAALPPNEIRKKGLIKVARALVKYTVMKCVVDWILPNHYSLVLRFPFYNPFSLVMTYLFAVRIYCMMGVTDFVMGIIQTLFAIPFHDVFNNPFWASSPKDFWNKRWNRAVSHMFHQYVFADIKKSEAKQKKDNDDKRFLSKSMLCGLLIFLISGLFHDFMIVAVTRDFTLELTTFFLLHGIAVMLQVKYGPKKEPQGIWHLLGNLMTVVFFVTTGRLFLGPILRHEEFVEIAKKF
ncbi:hypothetical protein K501DRAFT_250774 [Backusella circina FSU 941]|nr:hypothetical protein K501DRAFT_250774 [Backusella circina FSU 941]